MTSPGNKTDEELARVWQDAPEGDFVPFLDKAEKDALADSGAVVTLVDMRYVQNSQYGPRFGATLITPDGERRYITMKSSGGETPRDKVNKWLYNLLKEGKVTEVPCRIVRKGQAYMLDRPGEN